MFRHTLKTILAFLGGTLLTANQVSADIAGSDHDLGFGTGATSEICVFCHTPHGADTGASAPLWNKALPTGPYQRYSSLGTATLDGQEASVGSVSLACLSCHDGTQAMDVVINAPGSGGYNAGGSRFSGGAINFMTGTPIPNLQTDLRDDHPISIEYAGGACTTSTADCDPASGAPLAGDPDFVAIQFANINTNPQWWVDVSNPLNPGIANVREKTDMILYARTFSTGVGPSVECGSCHDPHEGTPRPVAFLRISNEDSNVCLACHIK